MRDTPDSDIAVAAGDPAWHAQAEQLARELGLPFCGEAAAPACAAHAFLLSYAPHAPLPVLQLQARGPDAPGPLYVDFVSGALGYRQRQAGHSREPLARAVGIKNRLTAPRVLDAGAGLGRDAFMLASLGCDVTLIERSPIIAALLKDGLERARAVAASAAIVARMHLVCGEAADYLIHLSEEARPDVVYLDPMYPGRQKTALVKKEMRYLRAVVGEDLDAPALLAAALRAARRRVLVKRPRLAAPLAGPPPSSTLMGSTTRFDLYAVAAPPPAR